jgi:methionine biosynthesis protein MetW
VDSIVMNGNKRGPIRADLQIIADMIEPSTRLLDVGCGDGLLLDYLSDAKQVDGRGIELSTAGVNACVCSGLSVIQGDAETDLKDYPKQAFDYVVLSQTLQAMASPKEVLSDMLRIGKYAIVSFPNFAYWRLRWQILTRGRMPVSKRLDFEWYETPNIHLCSIKDFVVLCDSMGITIERSFALDRVGNRRRVRSAMFLANLFGEQAVFLLSK